MRLALRRGRVASVEAQDDRTADLTVDVAGEARPARADVGLLGTMAVGDEVVVNVAARDLGLGSGGVDIVHVNLTRGLEGTGEPGAHVMKLNYTSVQHAVRPVEARAPEPGGPLAKPVAVLALHGQLAPVAWAAARERGVRIGYVQTAGGALPGGHLRDVRELQARGLLAGHVTAAPAYGGGEEAMTVAGALHAGLTLLGWDAAVVGPGPGIVGSGTALGHGGLAALDNAHAALVLGCRVVLVPRLSSGDPRERHRDLSHHTARVLESLLGRVTIAAPHERVALEAVGSRNRAALRSAGWADDLLAVAAEVGGVGPLEAGHRLRSVHVDLEGYRHSRLPARTMGRSVDDDPLFFRSALAGGVVLARELSP